MNVQSTLPRYIFIGQLQREFTILSDGRILLDHPGGNLIYAAVGLSIWEPEPPPGLVTRVGEDYPSEWITEFNYRGFNTQGIRILPEAVDLRSFYVFTDKVSRQSEDPVPHFARLGQPFPRMLLGYRPVKNLLDSRTRLLPSSVRQADVPEEYLDATAAHLCPMDFLTHSLMPAVLRQAGFTTVTLDPSKGMMNPAFWDDVPSILTGLTAFLSSEEEICGLFRGRSSDLWEMAETLAGYGCEFVIIKRGAGGQILFDAHSRARWEIPAYPARLIDATGVGDAFCGGFLAGYRRTFDPLQAVLHGNISASLVIEGSGPFFALDALPGLAQARLDALRDAVRKLNQESKMNDDLQTLLDPMLDLAVAIQQVAAPTFHEDLRASFVQAKFTSEGLVNVFQDDTGNVYARLPGENPGPPLVISAHLDTVFPAGTDLSVAFEPGKITGPGIGDNSLGLAGLFGLVWGLRHRKKVLPFDLWLVANTGEEGLGDLRGMKAVVEHFGKNVLAYIVLEGLALGHVYVRGLAVRRYQIEVHTGGGHSWVNYGSPSAIHEAAKLITQLAGLELPAEPRTTLNVGVISGGVSINTIAADTSLELDLRSENEKELARLDSRVQEMISAVNCADRDRISVASRVIGSRPYGEIDVEHPLVKLACRSLETVGLQPSLSIGSTDANIPFSLGLPAVCLGLTNGGRAHTKDEFINTPPLLQGLSQCLYLIEGVGEALLGNPMKRPT